MPKQKQKQNEHQPVLLEEVMRYLAPKPGESYLDLTAGYGGHSSAVLNVTGAPKAAVLVDRDNNAIEELGRLYGKSGAGLEHRDYLTALQELTRENRGFDMVLADLGVSSPHIEDADRGFAFSRPGPLDMRMDRRQDTQASYLVNQLPQEELAKILADYGEEPKARIIAKAIVAQRPIDDTAQLASIIAKAAGFRARRARTHPATRSFQALRIAVNDELAQLEQALPLIAQVLNPGGRMAIISFHSLEDRLVKRFLAEKAHKGYDAELHLLTKKPVTASQNELVSNPRARSAKLRAAAKINKQKG